MSLRVTLEQAVKSVVEQKVRDSESFSAYQITQKIRELSNKGEIDLMDCRDAKTVGGSVIKNIQHSKVKYLFSHKKCVPAKYRGVQKDINGVTYTLYIPPTPPAQQTVDILDI